MPPVSAWDPHVAAAAEDAAIVATGLGAEILPVSIPSLTVAGAAQLLTISVEALASHHRLLAERADLLPDDARLRLELGMFRRPTDVAVARRVRQRIREETATALTLMDVLVWPTVPVVALALG